MSEYIFGYILMFEKEIRENITLQNQKEWNWRLASPLNTKAIGIAGTGSIGKDFARIAKAFGMKTVGYSYSGAPVEHFDVVYSGDEFNDFLSQSDYVVSVLPNTETTNDMFGTTAFSSMKDSAVFINVGRGNAVDEEALVAAVEEKQIKAAVLDVMKEEPLPESSPLWNTEDIYVTPHMSGNFVSDALIDIFAENYRRFCAGEDLQYVIDLEKGY